MLTSRQNSLDYAKIPFSPRVRGMRPVRLGRQLLLPVLRGALQLHQLADLGQLSAPPKRLIQGTACRVPGRQRPEKVFLRILRLFLQLHQLHDLRQLSASSRRDIQRPPRSFPLRGHGRGGLAASGKFRNFPSVEYDGSCLGRERVCSREIAQETDGRHAWSLHV